MKNSIPKNGKLLEHIPVLDLLTNFLITRIMTITAKISDDLCPIVPTNKCGLSGQMMEDETLSCFYANTKTIEQDSSSQAHQRG